MAIITFSMTLFLFCPVKMTIYFLHLLETILKVCESLVNINNIFYLYSTEEWNRGDKGDKGNRRKNGRVIKAMR